MCDERSITFCAKRDSDVQLPCPALPSPALPCPAPPCPALPWPGLPWPCVARGGVGLHHPDLSRAQIGGTVSRERLLISVRAH